MSDANTPLRQSDDQAATSDPCLHTKSMADATTRTPVFFARAEWTGCRVTTKWLRRKALWALVPLAFYVCALLPVDTFVPIVRSTKRLVVLPVAKLETLSIHDEMGSLIESLIARKHLHSEYEGKLKVQAASDEIVAIEDYVGTRLPDDIRFFLERFDGLESGNSFRSICWLSRGEMLRNSREIAAIHSDYGRTPQTIAGAWYHPAIIVFDDNGGGGLGVNAFTGVIYEWDHDGGQLVQVAPSFRALLRGLDEQMKNREEPDWRNLNIR